MGKYHIHRAAKEEITNVARTRSHLLSYAESIIATCHPDPFRQRFQKICVIRIGYIHKDQINANNARV